jgi:hypothetical protein
MSLTLAACLTLTLITSANPVVDKVTQLAWMAGDWQCKLADGTTFQETWLPPLGGTMQGVGRNIRAGNVVFMEFLSIEADKDGNPIMYIMLGAPSKGEKKPVQFKLTSLTEKEALFEWPEHDFPSMITYSRKTKSSLLCRLTGNVKGKEEHEDYDFKPRPKG